MSVCVGGVCGKSCSPRSVNLCMFICAVCVCMSATMCNSVWSI